jgi:VanZ family protein
LSGRRWGPAVLCCGLILTATSIPDPPTPSFLPDGADKVVHFLMYGSLGLLVARALLSERGNWRTAILTLVFALAFAAVDEWHQQFIAGRSADAADWTADALGAATGSALALALRRRGGLAPHL